MRRTTAVLLLAGTLVGCATHSANESPWLVQRDTNMPRSCEPLTADQELVLGLSQEMASAGRRHAALANLERLPNEVPQVRLSKARLLRVLGHGSEAEMLFHGLLNSCLAADANHGLGQIEASRGSYPQAQSYLRTAASLSPASEAIRNDLGVVYMNQRRLSEAQFELLTAMELGDHSRRAAMNMLTLLVYQGQWQAAQELVAARGLSSADFKQAEQRAQAMRSQDAPETAALAAPTALVPPLVTPEPAGTAAAVASLVTPVTPVAAGQRPRAHPDPVPVAKPAPIPLSAIQPAAQAPARTSAPMRLSDAARAWAVEEAPASAAAAAQREVQSRSSAGRRPIVCRSSGEGSLRQAIMECLPE